MPPINFNRWELPTLRFPYKIKYRINMLSRPHRRSEPPKSVAFTPNGVRVSALRGQLTDRVHEASYPYVRRLLLTRRALRRRLPPERLERLDRLIEASNGTIYAKLSNYTIDLKRQDPNKMDKKKRGWTETEWKKHMEYIEKISVPRKSWEPPEVERGPSKPLSQMLDTINRLAEVPPPKMYRRLSQEEWYRDPEKISPAALKYNISERVKFLAQPRPNPDMDKDKEKKEE